MFIQQCKDFKATWIFFLTVHMALRRFFFARGRGVLPYITYRGMYRLTGRDFEAPDLERGIHFRGVF